MMRRSLPTIDWSPVLFEWHVGLQSIAPRVEAVLALVVGHLHHGQGDIHRKEFIRASSKQLRLFEHAGQIQ